MLAELNELFNCIILVYSLQRDYVILSFYQ